MREFRRWLAERLFPQAFKDQQAYQRMKSEAIDAYHWLGAYGDAADALRWLLDNDHNWRRAIGKPAIGSLPSSIDRFRDLLERRSISPPLEKRPAAFEVLDTDEGVYLTRSEIAAQRTGYEYNGLYRRDSAEAQTPPPSQGEVGT